MLSKLLRDDDGEVAPLVLRRASDIVPAPKAPPQSETPRRTEDFGEPARLRATIARLTSELEQQYKRGLQEGRVAGEADAREAAAAQVHDVLERLATTIADIAGTRSETIRRAEADTVRLSVEIARRILHRELSIDPAALEALTKAALEKLRHQEVVRVRVHPDQRPILQKCLDDAGRGQSIEVVDDPSQLQGGAIFEVSCGSLDASLDTQLREMERGLVHQLETRA